MERPGNFPHRRTTIRLRVEVYGKHGLNRLLRKEIADVQKLMIKSDAPGEAAPASPPGAPVLVETELLETIPAGEPSRQLVRDLRRFELTDGKSSKF